jgi:DNA-binding beta-propeller fold protein YncE
LGGVAAAVSAGCTRKKSAVYDIFVANEAGNALAVVDLSTFTLTKHILLGDAPTAVIADGGKPRAWALAPASGTVFEVDTESLEVIRKVNVGPAIAMRRQGRALWVLGKRTLSEIPLDTFHRGATLALPSDAHDFDLANSHDRAAISYGPSGSLSVIDLKDRTVGSAVKVADSIGAARFRSDGRGILVADTAARQLCVLDASARTIVNLPLAVRPDNLCFNHDGGQLFITGEGRDAVVVVFPYFVPQIAETVLAGNAPGAMAASPTHLFVANPKAGEVTILNATRRRIEAITGVGADPGFITITPDGNFALVLNRQSGDMAVIRAGGIVAQAAGRLKSAPLYTMIPVGSRPVAAAVKAV